MYRIGIFLNGKPSNGGSFQYTLALLNALSKLPHERYQVTGFYYNENWRNYLEKCNVDGVKFVEKNGYFITLIEHMLWRFHWRILSEILALLKAHFRELNRYKLDVVFAGSSVGAVRMLRIPTIVPVHDIMHRYERDIEELQQEYKAREIKYRYEAKRAGLILVDSELGKKQFVDSYSSFRKNLWDHVKILPFIPPTYIYDKKKSKEVRDLPDKYIFYPAQFWTHKNHAKLLEAIKILKQEGIIVYAVFCGSEQNNLSNVICLIHQMGLEEQIRIIGYVDNQEMVYLYRNARALVYPSLFGPTNIPPLEAINLGCPVAVSGIYAMPEQMKDAALYFDPRNPNSIAERIKELWTNDSLCNELIAKGYLRSQQWGQQQFADRVKEIIDNYLDICD